MSQGSLILPTSGTLSGLTLVQLVNAAHANLASLASGATDPATLSGGVQAFSLWLDLSVTPNTLRMRNAANNAWATMGTISGNNFVPDLQSTEIVAALGYTPARVDGANATGIWGIGITGNAATVTNGVYTNGSYSNPSWLTALAGSKITGGVAQLSTANFTVQESGGKLIFKCGATVVASISSAGEIVGASAITSDGTP